MIHNLHVPVDHIVFEVCFGGEELLRVFREFPVGGREVHTPEEDHAVDQIVDVLVVEEHSWGLSKRTTKNLTKPTT